MIIVLFHQFMRSDRPSFPPPLGLICHEQIHQFRLSCEVLAEILKRTKGNILVWLTVLSETVVLSWFVISAAVRHVWLIV